MENDRLMSSSELRTDHATKQGSMRRHSNSSVDIPRTLASPSSRNSQDVGRVKSSNETNREKDDASSLQPGTQLGNSRYVLYMASIYAALTLFAWIVMCVLTYRPMSTDVKDYGVSLQARGSYGPHAKRNGYESIFARTEGFFRAAQVIRSFVAVVTIPLISAVCSKAAVVFTQPKTQAALSLRQTMLLADRGWTDPLVYAGLICGGFKQYGTKLLVLAILLNILGGIIAPLQSLLLSTKTIKRPTYPNSHRQVADILDLGGDGEEIVLRTRSAITVADTTVPQSRLWTGESMDCSPLADFKDLSEACLESLPGKTFGNMSLLPDPFLAPLPADFGTGMVRQYLYRINSTAQRQIITEADFAADCDRDSATLYAQYGATTLGIENMIGWSNWSMVACMPATSNQSTWRKTRERQDFSEHLYLNLTGKLESRDNPLEGRVKRSEYSKITVTTTAGYFELPNYKNGQQPGPLLDEDPTMICGGNGSDCLKQYRRPSRNSSEDSQRNERHRRAESNDIVSIISNKTREFDSTSLRGPLLITALALFGPGSFIEERMTRPVAFLYPNVTWEERPEGNKPTPNPEVCVGRVPFANLLRSGMVVSYARCLTRNVHTHDHLQKEILDYAMMFEDPSGGGEQITNAFTSAAFLANEAMFSSAYMGGSWSVSSDYGTDTEVPVMSLSGIIGISVLICLFLTMLLGLAWYASSRVRWTEQLDSFAMLRIGASIPDKLQFRTVNVEDEEKIGTLDKLPGWIGDVTEGEGEVGRLALGGRGRLDGSREFEAYDVDFGR